MVAPKRSSIPRVAIVAGVRTPFVKAGASLRKTHVTELAARVMREVLDRAPWPDARVDEVILGNVIMPADAANPARVAALRAGLPRSIPALTVQRNCASGMEAVAEAAMRIASGRAQAILAAGAESMSSAPLLFPAESTEPFAALGRARSIGQKLAAAMKFRPRHFAPVPSLVQGLTDPTCNLIMGRTAEVLAHEFGLSRQEQDRYALDSHRKACRAIEAGTFEDRIVPVYAGDRFEPVANDVGPRSDQSPEALAKLKPFFDRRDGTVTVGNACQVTDGAVALLLMNADLARAEGLQVLGYVNAWTCAGLDPRRMGLGPVFAISRLLKETGLALENIDLVEINEAFAVQVLACLKALDSGDFARRELDRPTAVGAIDPKKLNLHGGAIALGHPVGASGARIVLDLLLNLHEEQAARGLSALCVGGGQGMAMLLERGNP